MALVLTDEKKGIIFRALAEKPLYEVGVQFELDKHYANAVAVKNKVYRIYQEVLKSPEKYYVSPEVCDVVRGIVASRHTSIAGKPQVTLRETIEAKEAEDNDVTALVLSGRTKAFKLLHKKLDSVGRNKKALETVSLPQLATVAAILFDKGQIAQGMATENVAVMAKIDSNLTPEEALASVLRFREVNIIQKEAQQKK